MSDEKPTYPSRTADQFVVRFPEGMRDRLKEAAAENKRSMNAEIVARLSASFEAPPTANPEVIEKGSALMNDINSALEEVFRVAKELRQIRRIPLPSGTKVSTDRLALLRPPMQDDEAVKRKMRPAAFLPASPVAGKKMRTKKLLKNRAGG